MVEIFIDEKPFEVDDGITVIQACEQAGVEIPRFCYHEKLSIAGNCRMCLVEMENSDLWPFAMPVAQGMKIKTNTEMVMKARRWSFAINHPLIVQSRKFNKLWHMVGIVVCRTKKAVKDKT